jgi:hypothetical protein
MGLSGQVSRSRLLVLKHKSRPPLLAGVSRFAEYPLSGALCHGLQGEDYCTLRVTVPVAVVVPEVPVMVKV